MEPQSNKTPIQHLFSGLKQCNPISEKLLTRLLERIGINLN
ncbi:hypothetical protein [Flavobacterium nitratireducens]|nr:hypothetical protein [Flavobacterium nitratireducens]